MAFNAGWTPNVPGDRNQSRPCQVYMGGVIGELDQNTPNQMNSTNPPVRHPHPPRQSNHMHQPRPLITDDVRTYDPVFPNQMAPFIPGNSGHFYGEAHDTARKMSGVHHFYLNRMVPGPSPSPPSSSLTRDIGMFRLSATAQMHMDPSFLPSVYMQDPRNNSELPFGAPRGPSDSDYFNPPPTSGDTNEQSFRPISAVDNNEQYSHSVYPLNGEQAPKPPNTTSSHKPKEPSTTSSDCTICLSPLPAPPKVALVDPCHHEFCLDCIQYWIQTQRKRPSVRVQQLTCPLCRGTIQRVIDRNGEVVGSRRRHQMDAANAAAEEQRRRDSDLVTHTGSRIEGVRGTLDTMSLDRGIGNQVVEVRRIRVRRGGASMGRSTREEDFESNGVANWWT